MPETESELEALFLEIVLANRIPAPTLQYHFHETRQWRFDFCWPNKMVAVEIQGVSPKQHPVTGLAHNSINRMHKDYEKHNIATLKGWSILYFMSNDLVVPHKEQTISLVRSALGIKNDNNNKKRFREHPIDIARREFDKIINRYSS